MRSIDRWRALDRHERRIAVRCAMALARAITIVRFAGPRRAFAWAHCATADRAKVDMVPRLVLGIARAARYVPGATCLARSLALAHLLRGEGVLASVVVGTMKGEHFAAHAWVEADGVALTDPGKADPFPAVEVRSN